MMIKLFFILYISSGDESHGSNKSEEFKEKNDDKNVKKSKNKTKNKKKQHEESKKTEISDTINLNTQKQKEIESLFDDN